MAIKAIVAFTDPSDFTFDPLKVEIGGGRAILAKQTPDTELSYYNFNTDADLTPTRGIYPLVKSGTAAVLGGKATVSTSIANYFTIDHNVLSPNRGNLQVKFTSDFSATASSMNVFDCYDETGATDAQFKVFITNQGGGLSRINWYMRLDNGAYAFNTIVAIHAFAIGQETDMLFSYDLDNGDTRFFINGVQEYFSSATGVQTFGADHIFRIGYAASNPATPQVPNFSIDDLQTDSEPHKFEDATAFPVPLEELFDYPADAQLITVNPLVTMDAIEAFVADEILNAGVITYVFRFSSVYYWWDGAAWVISNGTFAQSNTSAIIQANLATLPISDGVSARLEMFIQATDRYQTPEIDQVCIEYHFFLSSTSPVLCDIYGTVKDNSGKPVAGAKVSFDTPDHFYGENFIAPSVSVFTDAKGVFIAAVVETETTGELATVVIEYRQSGKDKKVTYKEVTIPNDIIARLSDIV